MSSLTGGDLKLWKAKNSMRNFPVKDGAFYFQRISIKPLD